LCNLFADVTAEDYVIEQVARRFLQRSQHRPFSYPGTIPKLRRDPGFTYRFPERSPVSEETSLFAVSPSDPRYYEETQSLTGQSFSGLDLFSTHFLDRHIKINIYSTNCSSLYSLADELLETYF
jgi:hypothetical protein